MAKEMETTHEREYCVFVKKWMFFFVFCLAFKLLVINFTKCGLYIFGSIDYHEENLIQFMQKAHGWSVCRFSRNLFSITIW